MMSRNKTARTAMRLTRPPAGWSIGVFVYIPSRENEKFVLLVHRDSFSTRSWPRARL